MITPTNLLISKDFLKKLIGLNFLNLPIGEFAITGSGPLAIRNIREAGDIDIIVKKTLWRKLSKIYPVVDEKKIKIANVEIWKSFLNLTPIIDKVIDRAEIIDSFPFMTLQDTLSWKNFLSREKDKKDITLIKTYLKKNL